MADQGDSTESTAKMALSATTTFSFTSPFPVTQTSQKQRRVSLASSSSPRLFPAWNFRDDTTIDSHVSNAVSSSSTLSPEKKGKIRKISTDDSKYRNSTGQPTEKRQRKKWTEEETQMLVDGCNIWGVGNWKAILNDPNLRFDNRSPVDLKDRFRTFFPDAYKQHYPNAKTHLSSKVRSTLPDGTSIFEKTRSKKRRPFTPEEDQALKAGYEKHGTVWSIIVKDPIFQAQKRRSTDLRDRFRNAFPHLYQAAGYKPRSLPKKKKDTEIRSAPFRSATDDQFVPPRSVTTVGRRRSRTNPCGSQSVPQSAFCTDTEDSSEGEDDDGFVAPRPKFNFQSRAEESTPQPEDILTTADSSLAEVDMQAVDPLADAIPFSDFTSRSYSDINDSSQSQTWSSGRQTPSQIGGWSSVDSTASPTSSHLSTTDYFGSEFQFDRPNGQMNLIGKSAWGPADWLSSNPRLELSGPPSNASSFFDGLSPAPSSPFSLSQLSTHGIMDRYDLSRSSFQSDYASEAGVGDSHSTFSDPDMFPTQSFRGFTHHSNYAGDLIFGTRSHSHSGFGLAGSSFGEGLGLTGVSSINPMQLHTPSLPGIDELSSIDELALNSIRLDDHVGDEDAAMASTAEIGVQKDDSDAGGAGLGSFDTDISTLINLPPQTLEEIVGLSMPPELDLGQGNVGTPPAGPVKFTRPPRDVSNPFVSLHSRSLSVPPVEHRSPSPSRPQQSPSTPQALPPRSISLFDTMSYVSDAAMAAPMNSTPASSADAFRHFGDLYDLPFLDLHYFNNNTNPANQALHSDIIEPGVEVQSRHGQALDLAQPASGPSTSSAPHIAGPSSAAASVHGSPSRSGAHHRGQSAVSPKDLFIRSSDRASGDNKRKRTSWDGGHP